VHHVTDVKTTQFYVSETGSAFAFRQEAPTVLDPIDRVILSHWVPTIATLTSVDKKKIVSVYSTVLSLFNTEFSTQYSDSHFQESHGEHAYSNSFDRPCNPPANTWGVTL